MHSIEQENLNKFRYGLFKTIALTTAFFAFFVAMLSLVSLFPLTPYYRNVLYVYAIVNLLAYYLFRYHKKNYFLSINMMILSALFTFTIMTGSVLHDEFRLVWFFLISFGAFILAGKYYGFVVTLLIALIVLYLHTTRDIHLSDYAIMTFMMALVAFNIFSYYFLRKIEHDSIHLQSRVLEEVSKQQNQEQMLLRQYRMAHLGEMIDAIAHQWRQPLTNANMILLNMDSQLDDKQYMKKKLEELATLNIHMSQTIDDFRSLVKEEKEKTHFNVEDVVKESLTLMRNSLKDISLSCDDSSDIALHGYKSELIQVMIILLSNAIEALSLKHIENKQIFINTQTDASDIVIHIEDNAGGINEAIIDTLFDPYASTKKHLGGSGLGLYIAHIIIEQNMQGELSVTNTSKGAKFSIRIKSRL